MQEQTERDNLLMLAKRRKLHLLQLSKWMATKSDNRDNEEVSTRSQEAGRKKLLVPFPRKTKVKRSFWYQASVMWNDLPTELHTINEAGSFKNRVLQCL